MNSFKSIILSAATAAAVIISPMEAAAADGFTIERGTDLTVSLPSSRRPVLNSAVALLGRDLRNVFGDTVAIVRKNGRIDIKIDPKAVKDVQGYRMEVTPDGRLAVTGHDSAGAAYALMELSRHIGVSPWEWWADAAPEARDSFSLPAGFVSSQAPDVEYRGIFINDEDWGLMPWSSSTHEPGNKRGVIGAKTNERIFELMLRLRANYYWPAMHECTEPFFLTPGNREMAERFGIYVGGSHCEPMASSTAVEWGRRGKGEYDYVGNSGNVYRFWEDRVKDVAGQEIVYTLGMRGVHDGAMNGAKTVEEQKAVLTRAIADQRGLLRKYVDKKVERVPQVFIPYKEVLDVYRAGLEVPEDVTLMWCDDNYGYIRHFPTAEEAARKGGNGIYYHVSYWGRPHDYLWLSSLSPYLMWQQMKLAYDKGIRKMWILNVGDIKPAEYQTGLFMDMAWDIDAVAERGIRGNMEDFYAREFGQKAAGEIVPVMDEYYRLASIRMPEFMGNTRTEERDRAYYNKVRDIAWSDRYVRDRIADYGALEEKADLIAGEIPANRRDTYYQLVEYPVKAAAEMNKKMLFAQLARHGKADWSRSREAYDSIVALTKIYNEGFSNGGKWKGIMDMRPRKLPVFNPVTPDTCQEPSVPDTRVIEARLHNGGNLIGHTGLGHTGHAVEIPLGKTAEYTLPASGQDSVCVYLNFLPVHPVVDGGGLKAEVSYGGGAPQTIDYATQGRSEEWKENILNGRAVRRLVFPSPAAGKSADTTLRIKALTEGIILDWIEVERE